LHAVEAVLSGFYDAYEGASDGCVMVSGQVALVDTDDRWLGVSGMLDVVSAETIAAHHLCNFASTVVRRDAYARAGAFDESLVHANDWEMWVRVAQLGPVGWVDRPYACFRRHRESDSARLQATSAYVRDCLRAVDRIVALFEGDAAAQARVRAGARTVVSDYALSVAAEHLAAGRWRAAARDAVWGVRIRPNLSTTGRAGDTILRAVASRARGWR
jgi:hypothetical protein